VFGIPQDDGFRHSCRSAPCWANFTWRLA
jgi:hypothetical protein